jgi:hypothetical protein
MCHGRQLLFQSCHGGLQGMYLGRIILQQSLNMPTSLHLASKRLGMLQHHNVGWKQSQAKNAEATGRQYHSSMIE